MGGQRGRVRTGLDRALALFQRGRGWLTAAGAAGLRAAGPSAESLEPLEPRFLLNLAPVLDPLVDLAGAEGSTVSLALGFTDADAADTHQATVDWGDGFVGPATVYENTGVGTILAEHTYADDGTYTVLVTLTDSGSPPAQAQRQATAQIANVAPTGTLLFDDFTDYDYDECTVVESGWFFAMPQVSDPGADTIASWRIDWGDGTVEAFPGAPTEGLHSYTDGPAECTVRIWVTDEDGEHEVAAATVVVVNMPPRLTVGGSPEVAAGVPYVLSLSAVNRGADTVTEWTIDWGDGVIDEGIPAGTPSAQHTYLDGDRSYTIRVTATDEDGSYRAPVLTLDPSLGGSGQVVTSVAGTGHAVLRQPDGKFLIVGARNVTGQGSNFALLRFHGDGAADTAFGANGVVTTDFGGQGLNDYGYAVALQDDGKIVVAGISDSRFAVARYTSAGALDTTFATGGRFTWSDGAPSFMCWHGGRGIAIQPDGRILIGGSVDGGGGSLLDVDGDQVALLRLTAAGTLDATFGQNGVAVVDLGGADRARSVLLQPDGRIVLSGNSGSQVALVRYLSSGQPDFSFGDGGATFTGLDGYAAYGYAAAQQADGRIVVAGYAREGTANRQFLVARYDADGHLDPTFGAGGVSLTDVQLGDEVADDVAIQEDGRIVVVGKSTRASEDGGYAFALARYLPDGRLDRTFGIEGTLSTTFTGSGSTAAGGVTIEPDGSILVAGTATGKFAAVRYRPVSGEVRVLGEPIRAVLNRASTREGELAVLGLESSEPLQQWEVDWGDGTAAQSLDPSATQATHTYADGPAAWIVRVRAQLSGGTWYEVPVRLTIGGIDYPGAGLGEAIDQIGPHRMITQPDGRIVVIGQSGSGGQCDFTVSRYLAGGEPDTTFGEEGVAVTDLGGHGDYPMAVLLDDAGRILVGGYTYAGGDYDFALARYTAAGQLDTSFNGTGVLQIDFAGGDDLLRSMALHRSGGVIDGIILAGSTHAAGQHDVAVARVGVGGTLTWATTADFGGPSAIGTAVTTQADGRIAVAGTDVDAEGVRRLAMLRYAPDGQLDSSFGVDGKFVCAAGPAGPVPVVLFEQFDAGTPLGLLAVGSADVSEGNRGFFAVRVTPAGELDATTFGVGGFFQADLGPGRDEARWAAVDAAGRVVIAGAAWDGQQEDFDLALVRMNPDGTLDGTFGRSVFEWSAGDDLAEGVVFLPGGGMLVGASSAGPRGANFALAPYADNGKLVGLRLEVANVPPVLTLAGPASIDVGESYVLQLSVQDVPADAIQTWRIDWGDGQESQIDCSGGVPASASHTFQLAAAQTSATLGIRSQAQDEDGTWHSNVLWVRVDDPAPTAPRHLDGRLKATGVELTWQPGERVGHYAVYRAAYGEAEQLLATTAALEYLDPRAGLTPKTTYEYWVEAVNAHGSAKSGIVTIPVPAEPPAAPTNLAAVGGKRVVSLTWELPVSTAVPRLYRRLAGSGPADWDVIRTLEPGVVAFEDELVADGTAYVYAVSALRDGFEGQQSQPAEGLTIPAPPALVTAEYDGSQAPGNLRILVEWSASMGAAQYQLFRGQSESSLTGLGTPVDASILETMDEHLAAGTTYYYAVAAGNDSGWSDLSLIASARTPAAPPASLTATAERDHVELAWPEVPGADRYDLYRSTSTLRPSFPFAEHIEGESFDDYWITLETTFNYWVVAWVDDDPTPPSPMASATTYPFAPDRVWHSIPSNASGVPTAGQIRLDWGGGTGAEYAVYRSQSAGDLGTCVHTTQGQEYDWLDTTVAAGATYYYTVVAHARGVESTPSQQIMASPLPVPPAPLHVGVEQVEESTGEHSHRIYWTMTTTWLDASESYYGIYIRGDGGAAQPIGAEVASILTHTPPVLYYEVRYPAGTTQEFGVAAHNAAGRSEITWADVTVTEWAQDVDLLLRMDADNDGANCGFLGPRAAIDHDLQHDDDLPGMYVPLEPGGPPERLTWLEVVSRNQAFVTSGQWRFVFDESRLSVWKLTYDGQLTSPPAQVHSGDVLSGGIAETGITYAISGRSAGPARIAVEGRIGAGDFVERDYAFVTVLPDPVFSVGGVVVVNANDDDGDGVTDYYDGYDYDRSSTAEPLERDDATEPPEGAAGTPEAFVPLEIRLPAPLDMSKASVRLYFGVGESDLRLSPAASHRTAPPVAGQPYVYGVPSQPIRLWTADGFTERDWAWTISDGHAVPPTGRDVYGQPVHWTVPYGEFGPADLALLGFGESGTATLYVEGLHAGTAWVRVEVDPDGPAGPARFIRAGVQQMPVLDADFETIWLAANDDDGGAGGSENDGIPDFADGFGRFGGGSHGDNDLVPFTLSVASVQGLNDLSFELAYSASDPDEDSLTREGAGTLANPYRYLLPSEGSLRLWRTNGSERDLDDYLAPGTYSAAALGLDADHLTVTFYVEGVRESAVLGDQQILFTANGTVLAGNTQYRGIRAIVVQPCLAIDSDNDDDLGLPERQPEEDQVENNDAETDIDVAAGIVRPGKLIWANLGDCDEDGIPDYADGYNLSEHVALPFDPEVDDVYGYVPEELKENPMGQQFVPIVLRIPSTVDLRRARVQLCYDASDPLGVYTPNVGFAPAEGYLRLWTRRPGAIDDDRRDRRAFNDPGIGAHDRQNLGFYVPPTTGDGWTLYDLELLGMDAETREFTLYVEGVRVSEALGDQQILLSVDPDGLAPALGYMAADAVRLTVGAGDLDIDSDNNNEAGPDRSAYEERIEDAEGHSGKILVVNDADKNGNGVPDFADGYDGSHRPLDDPNVEDELERLIPITFEMPAWADLETVKFAFHYDGSDPESLPPAITGDHQGWAANPGKLRIWRRESGRSVADYIEPEAEYFAWQLTQDGQSARIVTLYVEAIRPSAKKGEDRIEVYINVAGDGLAENRLLLDAVRVFTLPGAQPDDASGAVRYFDGAAVLPAADLLSAGYDGPWGHGHTYSSQPVVDERALTGNNQIWGLPFLIQATSTIIVVQGATMRYFDVDRRTEPPTFRGRLGEQGQLVRWLGPNGDPREYILVEPDGSLWWFEDFEGPFLGQGSFLRYASPAGQPTEVTSTYPDGRVRTVTRGSDEYLYAYHADGVGAGMLAMVEWRRWADGNWRVLQRARYEYYGETDFAGGNARDLKAVVIESGEGEALDIRHYRYERHPDESDDEPSLLILAIGDDAYQRAVGGGHDPAALGPADSMASTASIAPYADFLFSYDQDGRVSRQTVQGAGGSSESSYCAQADFTYSYFESADGAVGPNIWSRKTVEGRPGGVERTVYTNHAGLALLSADNADDRTWTDYAEYGELDSASPYLLILAAGPATVTATSESHRDLVGKSGGGYAGLHADEGCVTHFGWDDRGYLTSESISHGTAGTLIPLRALTYADLPTPSDVFGLVPLPPGRLVTSETVYAEEGGGGAITTVYQYDGWQECHFEWRFTLLPKVLASQNGPHTLGGQGFWTAEQFDLFGRRIWSRDADGYQQQWMWNVATGALVWYCDGAGAATTVAVDDFGRPLAIVGPTGARTDFYYVDAIDRTEVWTRPELGPMQMVRVDRRTGWTDTAMFAKARNFYSNRTPLSLTLEFADYAGRPLWSDRYVDFAGSGYPTPGASALIRWDGEAQVGRSDYYRTTYHYDAAGRLDQVTNAVGTITRTVYDAIGRPIGTWLGTHEGQLVQIGSAVYDCGGVGDGNLTEQTLYPGAGAFNRVTCYYYDWRGRLVATKSGVDAGEDVAQPLAAFLEYDNLGRVVAECQYAAANWDPERIAEEGGSDADGVPDPRGGGFLRARVEHDWDDLGRSYETRVYGIGLDESGNAQAPYAPRITRTWYDGRGNVLKTAEPSGLVSKYVYDGAGRVTKQSLGDGAGDSSWQDACSVDGDHVLQQVLTTYDAEGNPTWVVSRERHHDTDAIGDLGSGSARISYLANVYDAAGRLVRTVNFGTNGGSAPDSVPTFHGATEYFPSYLLTEYAYDAAGNVSRIVDPRGIGASRVYDALGRPVQVVEADGYRVWGESRKTTLYQYDGLDHVRRSTQLLDRDRASGPHRTTAYDYGYTDGGLYNLSNDLLQVVRFPIDDDGGFGTQGNFEAYNYNRLGEVTERIERTGLRHVYTFDALGRVVSDKATNFPAGDLVDRHVEELRFRFDSFGRANVFASHDGSEGLVNEVRFIYTPYGDIAAEQQRTRVMWVELDGQKTYGGYSTRTVTYDHSGDSRSRLTGVTYPSGRTFDYGYLEGIDDAVSRLSYVAAGGVALESYDYLGTGTVVQRTREQPDMVMTFVQQVELSGFGDAHAIIDAGDQYAGLDRFGRVVDQFWLSSPGAQSSSLKSRAVDRFQYAYDANGNLLHSNNLVCPVLSQIYHADGIGYDDLNRSMRFAVGALGNARGGTKIDAIVLPTDCDEQWFLDAAGNPYPFLPNGQPTAQPSYDVLDRLGGGTEEYDGNGNVTVTRWDGSQTTTKHVFDAWGHLASRKTTSTLPTWVDVLLGPRVLDYDHHEQTLWYAYDALGRRIMLAMADATTGQQETTQYVYDLAGRVVEDARCLNATTGTFATQYEYVWSPVLPEGMILRDGGPFGRLYVQQDAQGNVTSLADAAGQVLQRYTYDRFGQAQPRRPELAWQVVNAQGTTAEVWPAGGVACDWVYLYRGGRLSSTGFYSREGREYDPSTGRWIQPDLAAYLDGFNAYWDGQIARCEQTAFWYNLYPTLVHATLDLAGMIPVFGFAFDLSNAALYASEGDWEQMGWSLASAVPGAGAAATAGKYVKNASRAGRVARGWRYAEVGVNLAQSGRAVGQGLESGNWLQVGVGVAGAGINLTYGVKLVQASRAAAAAGRAQGSAPMTGYTWNQVLQARYGAADVEWVAPKMPSRPLTLGVLRTPAGEFELASGWNGYGAMMPKGSPGFDIVTRTHVEGQAAALMRRQDITEGMLYMNNPASCASCIRNLPYMLGPDRTLDVYPLIHGPVRYTGVVR